MSDPDEQLRAGDPSGDGATGASTRPVFATDSTENTSEAARAQASAVATQERAKSTPSSGSAKPVRRPGDVIFTTASVGSALMILVILAGVASFLVWQALPVVTDKEGSGASTGGLDFVRYVWPMLAGTLLASFIAMLVAVPIAVGIALFISHYAPRRLGSAIGFVIDLLAAIPSVVFGMWGAQVLARYVGPYYGWIADTFNLGSYAPSGRTLLTASLVLAVMILPIITSVSREVFLQTPRLHEEAALALGATKWEMIKTTVLPFGRPGVIGGVMLGLGRALGETMAVTMILSASNKFSWNIFNQGNNTIPSEIALNYPEAHGFRLAELVAAGLVLFILTFAVNLVARWIVDRRAEFSGAN